MLTKMKKVKTQSPIMTIKLTLRYLTWPCTFKSFQTFCRYYFAFPSNLVHFKQAAVMVFHSHLLLVLAPTFTVINLARKFWLPFDCMDEWSLH